MSACALSSKHGHASSGSKISYSDKVGGFPPPTPQYKKPCNSWTPRLGPNHDDHGGTVQAVHFMGSTS
eukprot:1596707-Rhodomonas_salina.2